MRTRTFKLFGLGMALAFLALALNNGQVGAHFDPPGPPPIETNVLLRSVVLYDFEDLRDGVDGNAEFLLKINVNHRNHGQDTKAFEIDDLTTAAWDILTGIWTHRECTPRETITVGTALIELDTTVTDQVMIALATAASELAAVTLGAGMPASIALAAGGLVGSLANALNGNDDLGQGSGLVPGNGQVVVESIGADGRADIADILVLGQTKEIADTGQCDLPAPPQPAPEPLPPLPERAYRIFKPLQDAVDLVPKIDAEPGNPAGLTEPQLEDIRRTLLRFIIGLAEMIAGAEIEEAGRFEGVADAIAMFEFAQKLAWGVMPDPALATKAIELYEQAFLAAAAAVAAALPGPEIRLPFQLSITPDFLSTKPNAKPKFLMAVFGIPNRVVIITPLGEHQVVQIGEAPVYWIELDLEDVPPGEHELEVTATDGEQEAGRNVKFIVNPPTAPPP